MTTRIVAFAVAVLAVTPLWAQPADATDPAQIPENEQPNWENYQRNTGATRLGWDLRTIAAGRSAAPPPAEFAQLIARGLADGATDSREGALMAIASKSGTRHAPTPENFAMWHTYRETLLAFRPLVEALLYDQDEWMRQSALLAFGALNMRPAEGKWIVDLDDDALRTYVNLFHYDPSPGVRSEIVKLFWLCDCREDILEARRQLFREAIYDTNPGVVGYAIRGAAELKIADVLEFIVRRLRDPEDNARLEAATAMQVYGREAARYLPEINAALAEETHPDIQGILKAAIKMVSEP